MASIRSKLYSGLLRRMFRKQIFGTEQEDLLQARHKMEKGGLLSPLMRARAPSQKVTINGCYGEWLGATDASHTLLYLHGGGYVMGSPKTHRAMVRAICRFADIRALVLDYRLAPEHPFPAAIEDAEAAYDYLLQNGVSPETLFVAGDSAGGGLSLALMLTLKAKGKAQPRAAALLSPWTDLTASGTSAHERAMRDPMIDISRLPATVDFYRGLVPADDPLVSPLFNALDGLAPLFVQVGTEEVLFDDATRLVEKAQKAGTEAELQIWQDMPHVHQIAWRLVPEGKAALKDIARFFSRHKG